MSAVCKAEGITFRYFEQSTRNILENVSLSFESGEVTVILGNSGCGKSTLAAVLCGLYPENGGYLDSGKVFVDGKDISSLSIRERSRYISQMFQNPDLQFCMGNLRDELRFCLENTGTPTEEMDTLIQDFAKRFGVEALLQQPFPSLSGGEKQKAALCCLLLLNPKVMILDEPFANLDHQAAMQFLDLLKKKTADEQTSVIVIDHQAENWLTAADRFLILGEKGEVIRERIPADQLREEQALLQKLGLSDPFETTQKKKAVQTEGAVVLSLQNASIHHRSHGPALLKKLSLEARKGQMIALLGPSGSGKTSLLLTLLGQKPYEGSITLMGKELKTIRKRNLFSRIGIVFQNPGNQFIAPTVLGELLESLRIWKKQSGEEAEQEARRLLASYGLHHYVQYSPYMLSQGQQRRLGALSMLAGGQAILLLDEPTYGQDGGTTRAMMDQMQQRVQDGLTVIFSTHDERLAREYADKQWRVRGGTIYEED